MELNDIFDYSPPTSLSNYESSEMISSDYSHLDENSFPLANVIQVTFFCDFFFFYIFNFFGIFQFFNTKIDMEV